jgi:hypothetical protein
VSEIFNSLTVASAVPSCFHHECEPDTSGSQADVAKHPTLGPSTKCTFNDMVRAVECGVPPETKDPALLHYPTRRSVGYFSAVRLRDGKFLFRRETDKFNALTCWKFLQRLQTPGTRTDRREVVITDNAPYHHPRLHREWREEHAHRFALDCLPAYSPELHPIERVWNSPVADACTIDTSRVWTTLYMRLKASSPRGLDPTTPRANCAQLLRTLCIADADFREISTVVLSARHTWAVPLCRVDLETRRGDAKTKFP